MLLGRREHARVNPGAAGGRAVVLQVGERTDRLAAWLSPARCVAVDLLQDAARADGSSLIRQSRVGLLVEVVPDQRLDRPIALLLAVGVQLLEPQAEVVGEPDVGAGVVGRIGGLVVPLHQPLRVGEAAVGLGDRRRRQEEHLGLDVLRLQLAAGHLRRILPEGGRLGLVQVADDQPVELGQRLPLERGVLAADRRGSGPSRRSP